MARKMIIHAPNVHTGGGAVLLNALLKHLPKDTAVYLQVDARFKSEALSSIDKVFKIKPTIFNRLFAERRLSKLAERGDIVLCFGNLPPLFKNRGKVFIYFQNCLLITSETLRGFSVKTKIRLLVERFWLKTFYSHADQFIVQTPTMERLLLACFGNAVVKVLPFSDGLFEDKAGAAQGETKQYDFIYVASGDPYKNHKRLIEAWCLLAQDNLYPSLCLTVPEQKYPSLWRWIVEQQQQFQLKISNVNSTTREELAALYRTSSAVIYPSLFESFGLPLIEAHDAGMPILAGELNYVRDIVVPAQTFDPLSPVSIKRAVKRFIGKEESAIEILTAEEFLKKLQ